LKGKIEVEKLITMNSQQLANEELILYRKQREQISLKNVMKDESSDMLLVKKTHKGEEQVDTDDITTVSEYTDFPKKENGEKIRERTPSPPPSMDFDNDSPKKRQPKKIKLQDPGISLEKLEEIKNSNIDSFENRLQKRKSLDETKKKKI